MTATSPLSAHPVAMDAVTAPAATLGAYAVLHRLGSTSGSTAQERGRDLRPGDRVPDGPPGTAEFVVEVADAPRVLVLHSRTHLPPCWDTKVGASLDWVCTFALDEVAGGGTRMLVRNRGRVEPPWRDLAYQAAIVPGDHVVTRGMVRGLEERVAS